MTRTTYRNMTLLAAALFGLMFLAIIIAKPPPQIIWNASPSVPVGLYAVDHLPRPQRGDLVIVTPAPRLARYLAQRGYLPLGIPLLKHVAALPGDTVCRFASVITINGHIAAIAQERDRQGRPLPNWQGCRHIDQEEFFLLNTAADSLDGRYFGVTPSSALTGHARPLLVRNTRSAPLRWQGLRFSTVFPHWAKEHSK
jgi:conjugative transfer signal peptidase TraF